MGTYKKEYCVYEGKENEFIGTITEIANHFKIDRKKIYYYKKIGYSIEGCIDYQLNGIKRVVDYTVFKGTDREFTGNLKQLAEHFNINYSTFTNRLSTLNYDIEKAIDYKSKRGVKKKNVDKSK